MSNSASPKNIKQKQKFQTFRMIRVMRNAADAIDRLRTRELRKYGITSAQAGALICINSMNNNATPTEISKWLFREPNSITILLQRMENMGLIDRKPDSKKKNLTRISLTIKGFEAYKHAIEFNSNDFISKALSEEKCEQLWSLLQAVRNSAFESLGVDRKIYSDVLDQRLIDR